MLKKHLISILCIGLILESLILLFQGIIDISLSDILKVLLTPRIEIEGNTDLEVARAVIWSIRMPRLVLGILVGASLAIAGTGIQGLFRNPLADPSLIGVSSGGAMGAVMAIVLFGGFPGDFLISLSLPLMAATGGILASLFIYKASKIEGILSVPTMLLTGLAVNALANAVIGLLIYVADNGQLRAFTFWSLGSLSDGGWRQVTIAYLVMLPCILILLFQSRSLNAMLLGENEAFHMGIPVHHVKRWIILVSSVMVGVSVALCGIIGFVGLVVPHLIRLIQGPDHRRLLPASAIAGSILVISADAIARSVIAPAELPLGILTALIGAPFFLYLLMMSKGRGQL